MDKPHRHTSHPAIINRLKRAEGHLRKVTGMMEAGQPCLKIAQQLHAVEKAIANAKKTLIEDHLNHCLDEMVGPLDARQRGEVEDFKAIAKYL
jgi:hypothetical protein NreA